MPAHKKHPSTRARRNKTAGAATLTRGGAAAEAPEAPSYDGLKIAELRALIDERNADGRPEDYRLSKRGSKAQLAAALTADDARLDGPPELPSRLDGWHEMTRRWWADVWASPMSSEWDDSDLHNLFICAALYDDMWCGATAKERKDAASEFRLQRTVLGLDPYSRRRLEWTIEAASEAQDRGQRRRSAGTPPAPAGKSGKGRPDPRAGLHAVS